MTLVTYKFFSLLYSYAVLCMLLLTVHCELILKLHILFHTYILVVTNVLVAAAVCNF